MKKAAIALTSVLLAGCATVGPTPGPSPQPPGYVRREPSGRHTVEPPRGWASIGLHFDSPENDVEEFLDEALAFSIDGGIYVIQEGSIGIGPEVGFLFSVHDAELTPVLDDDVDVARIMAGGRFSWFLQGTNIAPYVRGGWMFRWDEGDFVDDDGSGYYIGGGLDIMVTPQFSIAPQVMFTHADLSVDADDVLVGVNLSFSF